MDKMDKYSDEKAQELFLMLKHPKHFLIQCFKEVGANNDILTELKKLDPDKAKTVLKLMNQSEKSEKRSLKLFLKYHGLKFQDIGGDGDCQFSSIALQIYDSVEYSLLVRHQVINYIAQNPEDFQVWFAADPEEEEEEMTFEQWLDNMRCFEWGDELTLKAAVLLYNRPILIYDKEKKVCTYHKPEGAGFAGILSECPDKLVSNTIILIYNGHSHYDAVKHKEKDIKYIKITSEMKTLLEGLHEEREEMCESDSDSDDDEYEYEYEENDDEEDKDSNDDAPDEYEVSDNEEEDDSSDEEEYDYSSFVKS